MKLQFNPDILLSSGQYQAFNAPQHKDRTKCKLNLTINSILMINLLFTLFCTKSKLYLNFLTLLHENKNSPKCFRVQ